MCEDLELKLRGKILESSAYRCEFSMRRDVERETQTHKSKHFLHLRQKEEDRLIRRQRTNRGLTRGSRMCWVMEIIEDTF